MLHPFCRQVLQVAGKPYRAAYRTLVHYLASEAGTGRLTQAICNHEPIELVSKDVDTSATLNDLHDMQPQQYQARELLIFKNHS
jgi:hypothetical protein